MTDMTTNTDPLVEMRDIHISFGGVKAVDGVSIDLYPGEVVGVLGHNGAGKSTLIKILSGAYQADTGKIIVDGKEAKIENARDARDAWAWHGTARAAGKRRRDDEALAEWMEEARREVEKMDDASDNRQPLPSAAWPSGLADYADECVSFSQYPLSAACAIGRLLNAFENHWGIL